MNKKLIPNSTQIPNIILDYLVPLLPPAEGKCLLYISRRTYGFHKEEDRISFSQFTEGIKDKDGKQLDYGAGVLRPAINEGLKNLIKAKAIFVRKDTKGNYYTINLNMNLAEVVRKVNQLRKRTRVDRKNKPKQSRLKVVQKMNQSRKQSGSENKLVKKVNQLRNLTKSGSENKPILVRKHNPQNKGNKGNKVSMSPKATDWHLENEIKRLKEDKRRHIQIIGLWIKLKDLRPSNATQMQAIIKRNCQAAMTLIGYSDKAIQETIKVVEHTEYLKKWTLETITKYIDEVVAQKKKQGRKIIRFEEIKKLDGNVTMRAIYG